MQPEGSGHSVNCTNNGIGHVWTVDIMEVVASQQRQGVDGLDIAAPKRTEMDVLYGLIVILDVAQVTRRRGHDTARGKDHVDEREPRGIASSTFVVMFPKRCLVQYGREDVDTFEVGIDKSLPLVCPWNRRMYLGFSNCTEERNTAACIVIAGSIRG